MDQPYSDALVFFGATGDLAYKQIFPSLQKLAKRGKLAGPVIGVAKAGWDLDKLKARAKDSVEQHGGLDPQGLPILLEKLRYVDGDLGDEATYKAMSDEIGTGEHVLYYLEVPPFLFGRIAQGIASAGRASRYPPFGPGIDSRMPDCASAGRCFSR